jgi:hypothetical protein
MHEIEQPSDYLGRSGLWAALLQKKANETNIKIG